MPTVFSALVSLNRGADGGAQRLTGATMRLDA